MTDQDDDTDDSMLRVTTFKKTLFFLELVSEPAGKGADLPPSMRKLAKKLCAELTVEMENCRCMRSIVRQLLDSGRAPDIIEMLGGTPEEINSAKGLTRRKPARRQTEKKKEM